MDTHMPRSGSACNAIAFSHRPIMHAARSIGLALMSNQLPALPVTMSSRAYKGSSFPESQMASGYSS